MSGLFNFDDMESADWSQLTQYDGAGSLSSLLNTSSTAGNSNSNGLLGSEYVGKLGNSFNNGGFSVPASLNNSLNMSSMSALSTSSAGTAVAPHLLHHGQQQHGHQQQLPHHLQHLQHLGDDHLVPLSTQDRAVPTSPDASLSRRALNKAMQQQMQQQMQQTQPLRHSPPSAAAAAGTASNTDYMGRPLVPSSSAASASNTTTGSNSGVRTRGMKQAGANPSATTSTTAAVPTSTGTTASSSNNNNATSSTSHNTTTTTTTTAHSSPRGQRRYKYYPKDEEDEEDDDDSLPYNKRSKIVIDPDNMTPEELEAAKVEKNRQSARDCRLRKKRYMESLEKKLREAEATIAAQQQTIESLRQENRVLMALTSPTVPLSLASTSAASSSSTTAAAASGARSGSSAAVPSDEPISPTFEAVMKMVASS